MSKVTELFGVYTVREEPAEYKAVVKRQTCPFTNSVCTKMRKSTPDIKIGTCSVKYQNEDVIICPFRLLEHNQIFIDCLHLLTLHEPGNELYLIPEVSIPGGHVDYFFVSAKDGKVKDFVGIELQTLDTTGTVWPDRQKLLHEKGLEVPQEDLNDSRSYGMNWKMTLKTILIQMHHKSETFENLNKHFVLIIQEPLLRKMKSDFDFSDIEGVRLGDPVHIHSYDFKEKDGQMHLELKTRLSTDSAGVAKCLGLNAKKKVELEDLIRILEPKLTGDHRLKIGVPLT
jgi:hypothetical protein